MSKQKKQKYDGVVYSTNQDFEYSPFAALQEEVTPTNSKQQLRVGLDRKSRNGKTVTLVKGFAGKEDDLTELAKLLKQKCGVGGSIKDGEIIIQGDFKTRIIAILEEKLYKVKPFGG